MKSLGIRVTDTVYAAIKAAAGTTPSASSPNRKQPAPGPADTIPAAISTGRCTGTCGDESGGPPRRAGRAQAQQLDSVIDIGESVLMSYLGRPAFHSGTLDLLGASARPTDQMVMM